MGASLQSRTTKWGDTHKSIQSGEKQQHDIGFKKTSDFIYTPEPEYTKQWSKATKTQNTSAGMLTVSHPALPIQKVFKK